MPNTIRRVVRPPEKILDERAAREFAPAEVPVEEPATEVDDDEVVD